jgi:hypothetical protein
LSSNASSPSPHKGAEADRSGLRCDDWRSYSRFLPSVKGISDPAGTRAPSPARPGADPGADGAGRDRGRASSGPTSKPPPGDALPLGVPGDRPSTGLPRNVPANLTRGPTAHRMTTESVLPQGARVANGLRRRRDCATQQG